MRINRIDGQNFGINAPTVLSKKKMQTAIENMTGIPRNSRTAPSSNCMYRDPESYPLILIKYLATKIKNQFNK